MKNFKRLFSLYIFVLFLILTNISLYAEINPQPFVVPELKIWNGLEGNIPLSGHIILKDNKIRNVAEQFASDYKVMFGQELKIIKGKSSTGDILFVQTNDKSYNEESYQIVIDKQVVISARTIRGFYWATRTLLQISEQYQKRGLPRGIIKDEPEYRLRGFMIDCGRKYIPLNYLYKLIKVLAYYKMNTLQIHLNDNGFKQFFGDDWTKTQAAFRLECNTFPGLTAKDGSYSKKDFLDLQKYAEDNQVEIIPEIDVPAHSLAFTHYRPSLGSKEYGMDHLDLFNPSTYNFLDSLFAEYLGGREPIFRGKKVHIGTDEYSNTKQEVVEQFRSFTNHYIRLVESYGKQAVVWGALTHAKGETPVKADNVFMNCWYNGYADPQEMKRLGYKLISIPDSYVYIVPAAGYYYDYLNCEYLYNNWTPATIGDQVFEENDSSIEGGMFALWNDHVGNGISVKDIHHRIFPAIQTISVKCWTGKKTSLPYADYSELRKKISEAPGINELGRVGEINDTVLSIPRLIPNASLPFEEIGYDYKVSFTIKGEKEKNGTELFRSDNAIFYLSDPTTGKLGFERDGFNYVFNYCIEEGKETTISVEGTNKETLLFINGKLWQVLAPQTLYAIREKDLYNIKEENTTWHPRVYNPTSKIFFQQTLVFPLRHTGNFKSDITDLKVVVK